MRGRLAWAAKRGTVTVHATGAFRMTQTLTPKNRWSLIGPGIVVAATGVGAGDLVGNWSLYINSGTMQSGESIYVTCAAIQNDVPASPATTPVAEVMGTGYANVGTAHNSPSTALTITIAQMHTNSLNE